MSCRFSNRRRGEFPVSYLLSHPWLISNFRLPIRCQRILYIITRARRIWPTLELMPVWLILTLVGQPKIRSAYYKDSSILPCPVIGPTVHHISMLTTPALPLPHLLPCNHVDLTPKPGFYVADTQLQKYSHPHALTIFFQSFIHRLQITDANVGWPTC